MEHNRHRENNKRLILRKGIIILLWLCIWQLAAALAHNSILLVGPVQAGRSFLENITRPDFWKIVIYSFIRVGMGFFLALFWGLLLGGLAYCHPLTEEALSPFMMAVKSIPVASFVVLLLIWFGSGSLSLLISFLVVLPNVYVSTIAGLKSTDTEMLEMAEVFCIGGFNRFFCIYRPALMPYLISCLKTSLGMSWKSGVAAEIIGMPKYSLGERLYMSKVYLDTAGLFSWTLVIIILSFAFEKTVLYLVKKFDSWSPEPIHLVRHRADDSKSHIDGVKSPVNIGRSHISGGKSPANTGKSHADAPIGDIHIKDVSKAYDGRKVIDGFSHTFKQGGRYCLTAPSGAGKTTLLKLINRIERPDSGIIEGVSRRIGMVFQEDRLCGRYDTVTNIMLAADAGIDKEKIYEEASRILPKDCLNKPVSELSGGMRRRCAILRAMLSGSDIIIMDEPFNGLDEENRRKTASYISERLEGRTLLITSHRAQDIELFGGISVELSMPE